MKALKYSRASLSFIIAMKKYCNQCIGNPEFRAPYKMPSGFYSLTIAKKTASVVQEIYLILSLLIV